MTLTIPQLTQPTSVNCCCFVAGEQDPGVYILILSKTRSLYIIVLILSKTMGDTSSGLKAITINGAIQVESAEDLQKRRERRDKRKSRWDSSASNPKLAKKSDDCRTSSGIKDNPVAVRAASMLLPATVDVSKMDEKSQQIYILRMQIQEASMKLSRPDLGKVYFFYSDAGIVKSQVPTK